MTSVLHTKLGDVAQITGLVAFLTPVLLVYVPLSMAIILPSACLAMALCWVIGRNCRCSLDKLSTLLIVGMILTIALSAVWSYAPGLTLSKLPRTAVTCILGICFLSVVTGCDPDQRHRIARYLAAGVGTAIALIVIERLTGGMLFPVGVADKDLNFFLNQFNRPLSILSILIWPVAIWLAQFKLRYGIAAVIGTFLIMLTFNTGSAITAVAIGAIAFAIVYVAPRKAAILCGIVLSASVLLAPTIERAIPSPKSLFTSLEFSRSAYHRLLVWEFTTNKIEERPLLGWGFNASRVIPGGTARLDTFENALPLHPHNAALQIRMELGLLGILLAAGLCAAAVSSAYRKTRGRLEQAGAMATISAAFTIAMLSFGIWQSWWLSALFLATAFTVTVCGGVRRPAET